MNLQFYFFIYKNKKIDIIQGKVAYIDDYKVHFL